MTAVFALWAAFTPPARAQITPHWTIDKPAAERGHQAFLSNCAFCHGSDGRGSERAPDLLRSELVNRDDQGELIGQVVTKGRTEKGMPSFPALADQVKDIANFLHGNIQAASNRFSYKILNVVTGDAKRGEAYFKGAGGCGECHSVTGDLAGVGGKYKPDELQALMIYPGPNILSLMGLNLRHVDNPPIHVTATLKSGETVSGTAVHVGEFDIALHDESGAYRSFPRDAATKLDIQDPLEAHARLQSKLTDREVHDLLAYLAGLK
jgi:cytochrome c oxidase cbb3-type subunit 3